MADGPEVARAYVTIIPSMQGAQRTISEEMGAAADAAGAEAGGRASTSFGSALSTGLKAAGVAAAAVAAAVAGATKAFINGANDVAAYGDNIDKMSQKMGISAEAYQEWDFVMQHCGTSMESLRTGMKTLANAATTGNEAFEAIGITQDQIASMTQEELFGATISGLQNVEDTTERTYLAGQLLGRGATELGALLNMSAEDTDALKSQLSDLGGLMSGEAVKDAAAYQDSLMNMQTAFTGVKNTLMTSFLPGMTTVMDGLSAIFSGQDGGVEMVSTGMEAIVNQLNESMPQFLEAACGILSSLITVLSENLGPITTTVIDLLMQLIGAVVDALPEIVSGLMAGLPALITGVVDLVVNLMTHLDQIIVPIINAIPVVFQAIATAMTTAIPTLVAAMPGIITSIINAITEAIPLMIQTGVEFLTALIEDLPMIIETVLTAIPDIVLALVDLIIENIPLIIEAGVQLLTALITNLPEIITTVISSIPQIIQAIVSGLIERWPDIQQAGVELFTCLVTNIDEAVSSVLTALGSLLTSIYNGVVAGVSDMLAAGGQLVAGIWNGISNSLQWIKTKISGWVGDVMSFIKGLFGIASPSKLMRDEVGVFLGMGVAEGILDSTEDAEKAADKMKAGIMGELTGMGASLDVNGAMSATATGMLQVEAGDYARQEGVINNTIIAAANLIIQAINNMSTDIELDGVALARAIRPYTEAEAARVGGSLIMGGALA